MTLLFPLLLALSLQIPVVPEVDPAITDVVHRFFAAQEAEDASAYLALWSQKASRPTEAQLRFVFGSGDDKFSDLTLERVTVSGDTARVRVRVVRTRTGTGPDGKPRTSNSRLQVALTLVREEGGWKLLREGAPSDELAAALIDAADEDARKALLQQDPALANARLVESISRRADDLAQKGLHGAARTIYERSLEIARAIHDRSAEGEALQNIANSLFFTREFPKALTFYERRLALERDAANDEGIASALVGVGTIQYSTNDYGAALETYRQALAIQERLGDQSQLSTTLISTGNVLYLQGDYEAAVADYRRAEELKRKYHDLSGAATALEGIARVYRAQGDYASALAAFAGVLEERRTRGEPARQAATLHGIGEIHLTLANLDLARTSFGEARALFDKAKDASGAGRVLQGAAITELVAGRFPAGEKAYADSIAACTTADDRECVARGQVGLGFALSAQQKFRDAIGWYQKGIEAFGALGQREAVARAQIGLAEAFSGGGEHHLGLQQAINARQAAVVLNNDDVLWRALVSQARAERKLGRAAAALGTARAAVLAVRRITAAALERPLVVVSRDTTAAYATTVVMHAEAGDAVSAFELAEELRAHALRLWIAPHERDISRDMTDEERAEERRLAAELTTLLARREREGELPKPDASRLADLDKSIAEAVGRRNTARERLFTRLPALSTARGLVPPAGAKALDALLTDRTKAILTFVVDEHDVVVFSAVRPTASEPVKIDAHVVPLERQTLGERIGRALDGTSLTDADAWRKGTPDLFAVLPAAVKASMTDARQILVVPDDLLWRIPFEAMPVDGGYLGDRAVVTYAPFIAAVSSTAANAPTPTAMQAAIMAAPHIADRTVERLKATAPTWTLRPSDAALKEAAVVSAALKDGESVTLSGPDATPEALRARAHRSRALHIAAPFRVNSAGPLFSPILLATAATPNETAPERQFQLRDVFDLRLAGGVVTLSDGAALSMRDAAAAVAPLQWAWHSAGASALVVRRWGGSDDHAAVLLRRFYEQLRAGRSPADALEAGRAAVRGTAEGRAPAAWAGWLVLSARW